MPCVRGVQVSRHVEATHQFSWFRQKPGTQNIKQGSRAGFYWQMPDVCTDKSSISGLGGAIRCAPILKHGVGAMSSHPLDWPLSKNEKRDCVIRSYDQVGPAITNVRSNGGLPFRFLQMLTYTLTRNKDPSSGQSPGFINQFCKGHLVCNRQTCSMIN